MGALPKNKITRAERGKRRAGNTPNILKDPNIHAIPRHKRGLIAQIMRSVKPTDQPASKKAEKPAGKPADQRSSKPAKPAVKPDETATKPVTPKGQVADKASQTPRTQHKG